MNITVPQIIALFFGIIVISKATIDFRKKQENLQVYLFWVTSWIAIIVIAFYPMLIGEIINRFGAGNYTIGQIAGIGFVFIMYIVYRVYVKAHRLEKQMNQLIRDLALKWLKKDKNVPRRTRSAKKKK